MKSRNKKLNGKEMFPLKPYFDRFFLALLVGEGGESNSPLHHSNFSPSRSRKMRFVDSFGKLLKNLGQCTAS